MKKVLLISASVLALSAGAAFAQTSDPQSGFPAYPIASQVTNTPNQSPIAGDTSFIEQIGSNNNIGSGSGASAVYGVTQTGSHNNSEIYQGYGSTNSNYATASVTQVTSGTGSNTARTVQ